MPSFISIPLKRTYEVDLVEPVRKWIASSYSSSDHPEDPQAIQELNKLRNNAVCRTLDRHEASIEILTRYYDQLVATENKIPFSTTGVPVTFKWKDAFDKGSLFFGKASLTMCSGGFEKAAVLFNVGAMDSQVAGVQQMDSDAELKLCAKLFQQAAGVFSHLKENVMTWVGQEPTPDLTPDTLGALCALMLAQGQEAIYLKAARDKMKPAIVAKIAAQCADVYTDASKQLGREPIRGLFERESLSIVSAKASGFQGLAHYYQSLVAKDEKEIGIELAHLSKAHDLLSAGSCSQIFSEDFGGVQRAYQMAKKDNDFIYHERIPDVKTLPAIGKAVLAKAVPVKDPLTPGFKDLFGHLVPVAVQQAVAAYESRKSALQTGELNRLREGTQVLNGVLASLNLPACLEDALSAQTVPQSVREKASAVRAAGGVDAIHRMINDLPNLLQRNKEIVDETGRLLNDEKMLDDQLRQQHKERWTRLPSEKLTEPLWQELGKYRQILDTATQADNIVKQKLEGNRRGIQMLSGSDADLGSALPSLGGTGDAGAAANPSARKLKECLSRVEAIKQQRVDLENDLKNATFDMTGTFLRALGESGALQEEQLSTDKLNELYTPVRESITASIREQEGLVSEIQAAHAQFMSTTGAQGGAREALLKELASAHDAFMELRANLQEGTKFYNDLTPLLVRLQQKVSDFCFARKTEQEEILRDMQPSGGANTGGGGTSGGAKSQPPARPPPPMFQPAAGQQQHQQAAPPTPPSTNYGQQPNYGQPAMQQANAPPPAAPYPYGAPNHPQGGYPTYPGAGGYNPYGGGAPNTYGQSGYPPTPGVPYPQQQAPYGGSGYPAPQGQQQPGYNPYAPMPGGQPGYPTQQWGPR